MIPRLLFQHQLFFAAFLCVLCVFAPGVCAKDLL
jgi:hypothetical protein